MRKPGTASLAGAGILFGLADAAPTQVAAVAVDSLAAGSVGAAGGCFKAQVHSTGGITSTDRVEIGAGRLASQEGDILCDNY